MKESVPMALFEVTAIVPDVSTEPVDTNFDDEIPS